jgi:uncharacterized membrane protein HdeD (DUF308 family)
MTNLSVVERPRRSALANTAIGILLILAGVFVLGDVVLATVISAFVLGVIILCAGLAEIIGAFWAGGVRGFLWQALLGVLYVISGWWLVTQPVGGALILTWVFGAVLLISGVARIILGIRHLHNGGWLIFISGLFGLVAGFMILVGWPSTGLWVIGTFLGIDLILHGVGWLTVSFRSTGSA